MSINLTRNCWRAVQGLVERAAILRTKENESSGSLYFAHLYSSPETNRLKDCASVSWIRRIPAGGSKMVDIGQFMRNRSVKQAWTRSIALAKTFRLRDLAIPLSKTKIQNIVDFMQDCELVAWRKNRNPNRLRD
jgi:hypothetical protein